MKRRKLLSKTAAVFGIVCASVYAAPALGVPVSPSGQAIGVTLTNPDTGYSANAFLEPRPNSAGGGYNVFMSNNNGNTYSTIYQNGSDPNYFYGEAPSLVYGYVNERALAAPYLGGTSCAVNCTKD